MAKPKFYVVARFFFDTGPRNVSTTNVRHPNWTYEARVSRWGIIDRSIPVPNGLPHISDATIRCADTDRSLRDQLASEEGLRRLIELKLVKEGVSESETRTIYIGEVYDLKYGPGYVEFVIRDRNSTWMDEEIPNVVNRENYPNLPKGIDQAFFPVINGIVESIGENPQGQIELPHIESTPSLDRWGVSCVVIEAVTAVYRQLPDEAAYTLVPGGEYTVTSEFRSFIEYPIPETFFQFNPFYVDFAVQQPEGTRIRADVRGINARGTWEGIPGSADFEECRNPVSFFICMIFLIMNKSGTDSSIWDSDSIQETMNKMNTAIADSTESTGVAGFKCDGAITEAITVREWLGRFLASFDIDLFQKSDGRFAIDFTNDTDPLRPHFKEGYVIERDTLFEGKATPRCNRVKYRHAINYATGEWGAQPLFNNVEDQRALGTPVLDEDGNTVFDSVGDPEITLRFEDDVFDMYFVRELETAGAVTAHRMAFLSLGSYRPDWVMPLPEIYVPTEDPKVELAKLVGISHSQGAGVVGGYQNQEVKVTGITIDLDRFRVKVHSIFRVPQTPAPPPIFNAAARMFSGPGDLVATSTPSVMDLNVIYEVVSRPQQSNATEARSFNSSMIYFDPGWFDGETSLRFYWEFYAKNGGASDYDITIEDADTLGVLDTITIPTGQTLVTWGEQEFTPWGERLKIRMKLPQTANQNELQVYALRIRIEQRGATKTRLQFCLLGSHGGAINQFDLVFGDNRFIISGDTGYLEESAAAVFLKEAAAWANVVHWTMESVAGNTGFIGTSQFYFVLRNRNTADHVVENIHLSTFSETDIISTDFGHEASGFDEDGEFSFWSRESATQASNSKLLKAALYVTLNNLSKFAQYTVMARRQMLGSPLVNAGQLVRVAYESTLTENSAGTFGWQLGAADGPTESDTTVAVPGTATDPSGAKQRYRIDDAELIPGQNWYESIGVAGSGSSSKVASFLIFKYARTATPES